LFTAALAIAENELVLEGLGPEHSWASHAADAFGYLAISYEEPAASNSSGLNRRRPELPRGTFCSA